MTDKKKPKLEEDFYYDSQSLRQEESDLEFPVGDIQLHHSFGFQSHKRSNIHFIEDSVIISSIGNIVVFLNLKTSEQSYLVGIREGSIGALAVHPSKKFFAVGEIYKQGPYIYIYEYPSLKLYRVLKNGSERSYADIGFNSSGTKLVSVAGDPDYMLTIWDWKQEAIILRSKAFSQDVYKCSFSQENDGILTTSGMGHIKFWKMSSTFTGLKLQGYLGKFGSSELTDIVAFVQLPDGKVLSSTETGNLLLWDGGMIKCELASKGKKPCHLGKIETILMTEAEIITAGEDGYIRIWDLETIDNADVTSNTDTGSSVLQPRIFEMEPMDEILVAKDVKIRSAIRFPGSQDFLVHDQNGTLLRLDVTKRSIDKFLSFHSGAVVGVDSSPFTHRMATLGADGSLRFYDYKSKTNISKVSFAQGGSVMGYLPQQLDIAGNTIIAGFVDGVLRIATDTPNGINLQYVYKPHKQAITCYCISDDGAYIITGSEDKTIFVFSMDLPVKNGPQKTPFSRFTFTMKPLGFIQLEHVPVSISLSNEDNLSVSPFSKDKPKTIGHRCLISTRDGPLLSGILQPEAHWDNQTTFEFQMSKLSLEPWSLDIKEQKPIEIEIEEKKEDKKDDKKDEEKQITQSMVNLMIQQQKEKEVLLTNESKFHYCVFLRNGYFLGALMNKEGNLEIRLLNILSPSFSRLVYVGSSQVTRMSLNKTGRYLQLGLRDGTSTLLSFSQIEFVGPKPDEDHESMYRFESRFSSRVIEYKKRLETLEQGQKLSLIGQYWNGHGHDILNGRIAGTQTSFDEAFCFSAGADGGVLVWRITTETVKDPSSFQGDLGDQFNQFNQPEDITDPNAYSVQESKMKAEKDRELQLAESRKQAVRNVIHQLRSEFLQILQENESNQTQQVPRDQLNVDPYLEQDIEQEKLEKIVNVKKELQWISEKEAIGPRKLKQVFLDPLESELIQINAFNSTKTLCTFRTTKLDEEITRIVGRINDSDQTAIEQLIQQAQKEHREHAHLEQEKKQVLVKRDKIDRGSKLEARKQYRQARQAILKSLLEAKPDDKYEDPKDVQSIRYAQNNMGDYKLKSSPNYIVPESERIDADKKMRQIMLLRDSVHSLQQSFNKQVLRLRSKKTTLLDSFKDRQSKIKELNQELESLGEPSEEAPVIQEIEKEAFPESRYNVTQEDIQQVIKQDLESQSKRDDMFASAPVEKSTMHKIEIQAVEEKKQIQTLELDPSVVMTRKLQLKYQVEKMLKSIESDKKQFDQSLNALRQERAVLVSDLKAADMKLLLLYQEWVLLKEFEKFDKTLADKLDQKKHEQVELVQKIAECRDKVAQKKEEIELVVAQEKQVQEEFHRLIGDNNKQEEYLVKVFKRKIKRVKKKTKEEGSDDEEEESEDEDDFSDDDEEEEFEEKCPPELDHTSWQKLLDLREKRLDQEEVLSEIQKIVEALKKENESLVKKEKTVLMALKNTEQEIQEFQTQKQAKLNQLDVVVPLRFHQVYYLENNAVPQDLSSALVFVNNGLAKLRNRIKELHQEKADIKVQHKELKKHHVAFNKSKKEKQLKLDELEAKSRDVQMLKFGRIVDLEKLERLGVNRLADELREKQQKEDAIRMQQVSQVMKDISALQTDLTHLTKENTLKLERTVHLQEQKHRVEQVLNLGQTTVTAEYSGPQRKDVEEREKLVQLVQLQAQQIQKLKDEIENLIRKPTMPKQKQRQESQELSLREPTPPVLPQTIEEVEEV